MEQARRRKEIALARAKQKVDPVEAARDRSEAHWHEAAEMLQGRAALLQEHHIEEEQEYDLKPHRVDDAPDPA